MRTYINLDTKTFLRLTLMAQAIALMGITGFSTADPIVKHEHVGTYVELD